MNSLLKYLHRLTSQNLFIPQSETGLNTYFLEISQDLVHLLNLLFQPSLFVKTLLIKEHASMEKVCLMSKKALQ